MATFQTNADYYKAAPNFEPTQPNPTEKVGRATKKADCVVRAFSIVTGYSWLESFDILAEHARRTYNMVNDPLNYYEVFRERGYKEYTEKGFEVEQIAPTTLRIIYKGSPVLIYPYTGWFTGKAVKDGRGIHKLLKQLQ